MISSSQMLSHTAMNDILKSCELCPPPLRSRQDKNCGILRRRSSPEACKSVSAYVGGAVHFGHKRFGHGVLFGLQP